MSTASRRTMPPTRRGRPLSFIWFVAWCCLLQLLSPNYIVTTSGRELSSMLSADDSITPTTIDSLTSMLESLTVEDETETPTTTVGSLSVSMDHDDVSHNNGVNTVQTVNITHHSTEHTTTTKLHSTNHDNSNGNGRQTIDSPVLSPHPFGTSIQLEQSFGKS